MVWVGFIWFSTCFWWPPRIGAVAKKRHALNLPSNDLLKIRAKQEGFILSGQIIATSHDLTPNGGLVSETRLFQGNLGWWNSSLRSTHSIIKNTESGRQQGRMTVTAVRNDMWQDDERRNCWFSNDRTFYCVEMSTSYEHRSRLDDPPFATQVSSKKAFYPLTCDRSPILRSTHAAPAALVAKFASGNDFRDEASKISYVPRSSKIVTAQSKFTKEFAASVAQHIAHGKESHNTPLAGADVGVINEITKSRAHS